MSRAGLAWVLGLSFVLGTGCAKQPAAKPAEAQSSGAKNGTATGNPPPAPAKPPATNVAPAPAAEPPPLPPAAAPTPTPVQRGAQLYAGMCAVCHGENGEGYKADQAPMLAHPDFLASVSDEFLRIAIAHGRPGTTMSAWGTELGGPLHTDEVLALIAFMRSWQKQPVLALDDALRPGDAARGQAIFKRECTECHGEKGKYLKLINPELIQSASPGFLRQAIAKGRAPTKMPAYEAKLGAQGIDDVIVYLKNLPAQVRRANPTGLIEPAPLPLGPVPLNARGPEPKDFKPYPEMTAVAIVAREYQRKARMAILDARAPTDYAADHIAGAVSVPFYDPSPYLAKLPKKAWIVCYCGCPHAESGSLAMKLQAAGFEKVTVMDEGLWEWKAKGHPMKQGPKP
jgi:cytochrome c oxidase cbb3-type subunit 3